MVGVSGVNEKSASGPRFSVVSESVSLLSALPTTRVTVPGLTTSIRALAVPFERVRSPPVTVATASLRLSTLNETFGVAGAVRTEASMVPALRLYVQPPVPHSTPGWEESVVRFHSIP